MKHSLPMAPKEGDMSKTNAIWPVLIIPFNLITPFNLFFEKCEKKSFLNLCHIKINKK